jgi:hypothetical protein
MKMRNELCNLHKDTNVLHGMEVLLDMQIWQ